MKELARIFVPRFALAILISLGFALSCAVAHGEVPMEPAGSDVFVTPRQAQLREKGSPRGNILGTLPQGTRLKLIEARDRYLKVEVPGASPAWIAREVTVLFVPGEAATQDMVVVGRSFGKTDANRRLAACILLRASERLREAGTADPDVEVLLGETAEGVAAAGAPYPQELGIVERPGPNGAYARYDGVAFQRAAQMLSKDASPKYARTRERVTAGLLRMQYPERATSFQPLLQEAAAWIQLLETAEDPAVLASSAERAGTASLALGRFYLALGKTEEIGKLRDRLYAAGVRLRTIAPERVDGKRLVSRAAVLGAMRGNGTPAFPQEASVSGGSRQRVVRIDGKLGALQLVVETQAGATKDVQIRKTAIPILPVPGSLRISPDGRSVAWIEVSAPARLVPVMTSLDRDEEAREIAFLSTGRPLRDRELAHVVASLSGFSKDGQRLGLVIEAWNDTPGPAPRYSVVSVATGELLFETSEDLKGYQRLLR